MVPSIFQRMTQLSNQNNSINLGQGFPNWQIPTFLQQSLDKVIDENITSDNYSFGCLNLLNALSKEYSPIFNRNLDPMQNFMISNGGATVLSELCSGLSSNEEAIVIQPYFSFYEPMLRLFRSKIKFVKLIQDKSGRFLLDFDEIKNNISSKTKWIFLNSPHNPTGKVFTEKEYEFFSDLANEFPYLRFMSDEVYEHINFDDQPLPRLANVKGLWEKTVSIFSGGKTYSCTGWRIGWAVGPKNLIDQLKYTQNCTNTNASGIIQEALALAIPLGHEKYQGYENYYCYLKSVFEKNVKILEAALNDSGLGFKIYSPEGGYFLTADISESILKMPIYFLFSKEKRKNKLHLKTEFLKSIQEYQNYKGISI